MKKNILVLLLTVSILALNGGCTSKESQEDDQTIENADVEKIETIDNGDVALSDGDMAVAEAPTEAPADAAQAEAAPAEPPTADDAALEASLNEPSTTDTPAPEVAAEPPPPEVAAATPTIDESSLAGTEAPPPVTDAQLAPDPTLTAEPPPVDATATVADTGAGITETPVVATEVQPTPVSKPAAAGSALKKVALTTPYQAKNGGWINTVYIARPGEKLADIGQKIFGSDKTKDLKSISENNFLKWRAPRGGDKIYYVSPIRKMLSSGKHKQVVQSLMISQ